MSSTASAATLPAVSFTGARKSFGEKEVLHNISFKIERGEVVSLIGPSGAGKSTMLRCLTMLDRLDSGRMAYGDVVVCDNGPNGHAIYDKASMQAARMHFGLVFQDYNLFPHYTVLQNVCDAPIVVQKRNRGEVEAKARELLDELGLSEHVDKVPCQLSGGQQQRVAIARALAMEPSVMYFDEATSALDPKLTKDMHTLIRRLAAEGMAVGIVTHEMGFARGVSDRICLLLDGQIAEDGAPDDVIDSPSSEKAKAFLGMAVD